ncbi:unnamed protein product [Angiostrongylus costaricensis]|uniref:Serine/threonine-protein phosphatase n=1 Tax=Angiostrongylus costaricensis TaxID=334426 RepID=A0A0R3PMK6_ANGCS|nr:unnamed protein product [Angiostrongylus costaricensis]
MSLHAKISNVMCVVVGSGLLLFSNIFVVIEIRTALYKRIIGACLAYHLDKSSLLQYIFLGDYVDRGRRSLECVCLVLTLKILFPRKYQILRGNHECKGINRVYGFYDELLDRFEKEEAERLWLGFNEVFSWMPLAGLVGKKILCMHGGISAYLNSLDDIRKVLICFIFNKIDYRYAPNTVRGVATFFGEDAVIQCCEKLKVDLIVRAHQMMMSGYGFFCNRKLITIFTAPRYQPEAVGYSIRTIKLIT